MGTGSRNGRECFTCRRNFARFVYVENLLREEDFDENKDTTGTKLLDKHDSMQEQIRKGELLARPIICGYRSSGKSIQLVLFVYLCACVCVVFFLYDTRILIVILEIRYLQEKKSLGPNKECALWYLKIDIILEIYI